jgi:hypothetical protein
MKDKKIQEFIEFSKSVTPEGLYAYYQSLNRADRRSIDKRAADHKRTKHKVSLRRYNETRFAPITNIDE